MASIARGLGFIEFFTLSRRLVLLDFIVLVLVDGVLKRNDSFFLPLLPPCDNVVEILCPVLGIFVDAADSLVLVIEGVLRSAIIDGLPLTT